MTWLTVIEYLCHKWPRICSFCRSYNSVLSLEMTYYLVCNKSNTPGATCGEWTTNPFTCVYYPIFISNKQASKPRVPSGHNFGGFTVTIMTWLTSTKYMCDEWSRVCFVRRSHNPVFSASMAYHWLYSKSNTTGVISGARTAGAPEFIQGY